MLKIKKHLMIIALFFTVGICLIPYDSYAQNLCSADVDGKITDDFKVLNSTMVQDVILGIRSKLTAASARIYLAIYTSIDYQLSINAAIVLFITIYGILFMTGMIQLKLNDFLIRIVKLGIIAALLSPSSYLFFNNYVINFFENGTEDIIGFITNSSGSGAFFNWNPMQSISMFSVLDSALAKILSPKMFVILMATALYPFFGFILAIILFIAILSFLRAMMTALWVFVMAMVLRTLLFGLAPIFIPTILFQRTRHIFDGWIAQLVSSMIQPILLFIFFIFFVRLMEGALDNVMQANVCFSEFPEGWRGTPFGFSYWRFMDFTAAGWQPNTKGWELADKSPINMLALFTFFLIAEMANRFNSVIMQIAVQISQASTSLSTLANPVSAMSGGIGSFSRRFRGGNPFATTSLRANSSS
ncbi:MAG: type IV secretion system protein [Rickettsiales bacterium]